MGFLRGQNYAWWYYSVIWIDAGWDRAIGSKRKTDQSSYFRLEDPSHLHWASSRVNARAASWSKAHKLISYHRNCPVAPRTLRFIGWWRPFSDSSTKGGVHTGGLRARAARNCSSKSFRMQYLPESAWQLALAQEKPLSSLLDAEYFDLRVTQPAEDASNQERGQWRNQWVEAIAWWKTDARLYKARFNRWVPLDYRVGHYLSEKSQLDRNWRPGNCFCWVF